MGGLTEDILNIIKRSGSRLKPGLIAIILLGIILESLSVGLIVPMIFVLLKGKTGHAADLFNVFNGLIHFNSYQNFFYASLLGIVLLYLTKTFFILFVNARQNRFIYQLEIKLAGKLLQTYLEQPYVYHLHHSSVQLIRSIYSEVRNICLTVSQSLLLFSESLILLLLTFILFWFKPLITLACIIFLAAFVYLYIGFLKNRLKKWGVDKQKSDLGRTAVLSDTFNSIKDIKLYGRYLQFYKLYESRSEKSAFALMKFANFQKLPNIWLEFASVLSLIFLVGMLSYQGENLLTMIPLLSLYAAAMFRIMPSVNRISAAYQTIKLYRPILHSISTDLQLPSLSAVKNKDTGKPLPFTGEIKLDNVTLKHLGATQNTLHNLSLIINKGSYIGIIGKSGAGKSTLVDTIIGLLEPDSGQVLVDGKDVADNMRGWQDQIGYVSQTISLMDDTITRNIAFGVPDNEVDKVLLNNAITGAQLGDLINLLPHGLNTIVGERGVRLSGGQKQRIGIARALYHNPSVLVFDEATSALDPHTENGIMDSVGLLRGQRTIIFVTHKRLILQACDMVYEINNGQIAIAG